MAARNRVLEREREIIGFLLSLINEASTESPQWRDILLSWAEEELLTASELDSLLDLLWSAYRDRAGGE